MDNSAKKVISDYIETNKHHQTMHISELAVITICHLEQKVPKGLRWENLPIVVGVFLFS